MARVLLALTALVATNVFARDCLNDYVAGRITGAQYDACVAERSIGTANSKNGNVTCQAFDSCGRPCTDRNFGQACNTGGGLGGFLGGLFGGQGQSRLSSQQIFQLMLAYYAGFLSKDQLAQYLFYANPWQYYLLSYVYGDKAVDYLIQQYQIPFYQQLFGGSGSGNLNPWLFAAFLNQSGTR